MEFHVSRTARDRYQFDQSLFSVSGNVIFANLHAARLFAQKMNQQRDLVRFPENAVKAGQINALGLIDEILHMAIGQYHDSQPQVFSQALAWLDERYTPQKVDATLCRFADAFPPLAVYRREQALGDYLSGESDGKPNRLVLLEEMLMLWLTNVNLATTPYIDLFDDTNLRKDTLYLPILQGLHEFLDTQPPFGPDNQNLIDMLRSPAIAVPYSLPGQLEYIRERWSALLGRFLYRILGGLDLLKEEEVRFGVGGPGPSQVPTYQVDALAAEAENFSPDQVWMPRLVLIAKNTYVWLDQLTRQFQRTITRLDQIPDEELAQMAQRGFTGLWLIGLWERSAASKNVKVMMGNPEAVASAYSLDSYEIAADLGGEEAYRDLRDRAWRHGIRLASDMVPNHMGIDSKWMLEHPEWFLSLDYSPYPSYSFNGPDLSPDGRAGIFLEDHYYTRSDAAVVFKHLDRWSGRERYVYHGNDGTSMPWNDTAQLNYLNPEVREAVIQTILAVARRFPIIRFDAAMTLAKKHYQRLWFPEPGTGGAIPSRAEHGMTKDQFDAAMPVEFWREVVDRVAVEAPGTLLLAEAFWMMEGYFVRTLGMHRVYNSAFMNMLRNEVNVNYRTAIKNTLEFDAEILKRYVNFMNNPDERTAVDQFGKGDKYFGIAVLMSTLPGLPMFGHGQVEGYAEKYGMEFRRAYWDEHPDQDLVRRHEREVFPILHRRQLFSGVENFLLYDFFSPEGSVNEDVYAFSNGIGSERALVLFHNRFASTRGWVRTSVSYTIKSGDSRQSMQKSLGEGLGLHNDDSHYVIFRDSISGLEYIRASRQIHQEGLYAELDAYKYHVFIDFREVVDDEWHSYQQLTAYMGGRGAPSIDEALRELFLAPVHQPFRQLAGSASITRLVGAVVTDPKESVDPRLLDEYEGKTQEFLRQIRHFSGGTQDERPVAGGIRRQLKAILELPVLDQRYPLPGSKRYEKAMKFLLEPLTSGSQRWLTMLGWLFVHDTGKVSGDPDPALLSRSWIDEWQLGRVIASSALDLGMDNDAAWKLVTTIKTLTSHQAWFDQYRAEPAVSLVESWLEDSEIQGFLGMNRFKGVLWYNQENFGILLWWMMFLAVMEILGDPEKSGSDVVEQVIACYDIIQQLQDADQLSGYQVEKLLEALKEG